MRLSELGRHRAATVELSERLAPYLSAKTTRILQQYSRMYRSDRWNFGIQEGAGVSVAKRRSLRCSASSALQAGPDKGTKIAAHNDPLGISAPRIKIQIKRRAGMVNVGDLRSFIAVPVEHDLGIFVSLGRFSRDAEDEARTRETRELILVDLEKLVDLWVVQYETIAESDKRLLPLKPVYHLTPSE
jgi:predicted Mrr-cat superfamily restriction endonuclease